MKHGTFGGDGEDFQPQPKKWGGDKVQTLARRFLSSDVSSHRIGSVEGPKMRTNLFSADRT